MKKLLVLALAFSAFAGTAAAKGWEPLFAPDLSNAKYDPSVWSLGNGVLSADADKEIWTTREYENFTLELEFKTDEATNSGVIVYCTDRDNWIPNSAEIQIADDHSPKFKNERGDTKSGAIYGHLAPKEVEVVKKPGEWNKFQITCKGRNITVVLNGKKVTEMDMSLWTSGKVNPDGTDIPSWLPTPFAELPTKGYIGLQGKHGAAKIWFRNMRIKEF